MYESWCWKWWLVWWLAWWNLLSLRLSLCSPPSPPSLPSLLCSQSFDAPPRPPLCARCHPWHHHPPFSTFALPSTSSNNPGANRTDAFDPTKVVVLLPPLRRTWVDQGLLSILGLMALLAHDCDRWDCTTNDTCHELALIYDREVPVSFWRSMRWTMRWTMTRRTTKRSLNHTTGPSRLPTDTHFGRC